MARPQAEIRKMVREELLARPAATALVAKRTGLPHRAAKWTIENMLRAGELEVCDRVRVHYYNRPVAVYRIKTATDEPRPDAVLQGWLSAVFRGGE